MIPELAFEMPKLWDWRGYSGEFWRKSCREGMYLRKPPQEVERHLRVREGNNKERKNRSILSCNGNRKDIQSQE